MIPLSPKLKMVIGLALIAAVGALHALLQAEPQWAAWGGVVLQVLTAAELYVTIPGGGGAGPANTNATRILGALAMVLLAVAFMLVQACASLAQFESEVAAGDAILAPLVGEVCQVVGQVDASKGATITCDILDAAGNVIGQVTSLQPPATVALVLSKHAKKSVAK